MMKYKIPLSKPNITEEDKMAVKRCLDSSWISSKSPLVDKFEAEFAKKVSKTKYAASVNSATSAIFLALKSLGIGAGDEVIIPTFTMIATVNAVSWTGARPVLVDSVSFDDWNMETEQVEKKITKATKAIIPVHIYGYPCQMDEIQKIAKKYNLFIVEDAAEAIGSRYKGKNAGSFGIFSCFSLYVNKIITTGNGGIASTNNYYLYNKIKKISFFDFGEKKHFEHREIGYNLVMPGILASLGISQLKRLESLLDKRKKVFGWYRKHFDGWKYIRFIEPTKWQEPNFWFPAAVFKTERILKKVVRSLEANGVESRPFFKPIHLQEAYGADFAGEEYPFGEFFYRHGLLLPSFFDLSEREIKYICKVVKTAI